MAEREAGPEGTPVGGSRRRSRPPQGAVPFDPPPADADHDPPDRGGWPPSIRPILDKPLDDACPWLYLHADPDARAAFVTAEHRCEIRPDEVPGPGHQLAYCLTTNHISCPQLRNYEARRRSEAEIARAKQTPPAPPAPPRHEPAPALADFRASLVSGRSSRSSGGFMASRFAWGAMGALGALVIIAGVALYANPNDVSSADPGSAPASLPQAGVPTPDATTRLAAPPPADSPTSTPPVEAPTEAASTNPDAGPTGSDAEPEAAVNETQDSLDSLSALGPGAEAEPAVPTETPTPPPVYIVRSGDTLGQIAQNLGINVIALAAANNITTSTLIFVGDQLLLPVEAPATPPLAGDPTSDGSPILD